MSKRLLFLEKTVADGSVDPFVNYCLAQEYRAKKRFSEALAAFKRIRSLSVTYLPAYLLAGQLLEELGRGAEATEWCLAGIEQAKAVRDGHTLGELESLLARVQSA